MRVALLLLAAVACGEPASGFVKRSLEPGPNPFGPDDPLWAEQPHRDRPRGIALSADGARLYVALQGTVDAPGDRVAVVDLATERVVRRIPVGSSPTRLALHPGGRYMVATNRFSNWASVIDTERDEVVADVEVPFYTIDVAFTPDGRRAFLTNRWKDSVLRWDVDVDDGFRVVADNYRGIAPDLPMGIPVATNPRDLALSGDGARLYVGSPTGLEVAIIDTATERVVRRIALGSPPGDVAVAGDYLIVTHTGAGTHHPPDAGYDTDGDGAPGDSTANVMFQDVQNEIAVFDLAGDPVRNYTSDSMCCFDYRDVDPDAPTRGEALPAPDTWPRSRVDYLPPRDTWIVACALPQQLAVAGDRVITVCSGSNEVQTFALAGGGALAPRETAGGLYPTGMFPFAVAVAPDGGRAYVAEHLGEHVTVLDLAAGPGSERRIVVGDVAAGPFPATDAELGEAINNVTAPFTVDGDQTCVHCHREGGNMAKPVAMPLQSDPVWGTRMQMAYRGAADTRPWFFESAMAETNFFPVINEFARKENFCCEQLDPLIWSGYPALSDCVDDPSLAGCNHVLDCPNDPPPECAARGYGSPHLARNEHFVAAAVRLFGRDRTFGDALYEDIAGPDGTITRRGIKLDFTGVTRAIGVFLLQEPRLLPNPWAALDLPAARRGRQLFESPATGCASCHPLPTTTIASDDTGATVPLRFRAVITPRRNLDTGADADRVNPLFMGAFPDTQQDEAGVYFGVPQLRGLWDRAPLFFHDGRARGLREALATPGHAALHPDEIGCNETDGMPDTHGGTSHLTARDLDDLIAFLLTL